MEIDSKTATRPTWAFEKPDANLSLNEEAGADFAAEHQEGDEKNLGHAENVERLEPDLAMGFAPIQISHPNTKKADGFYGLAIDSAGHIDDSESNLVSVQPSAEKTERQAPMLFDASTLLPIVARSPSDLVAQPVPIATVGLGDSIGGSLDTDFSEPKTSETLRSVTPASDSKGKLAGGTTAIAAKIAARPEKSMESGKLFEKANSKSDVSSNNTAETPLDEKISRLDRPRQIKETRDIAISTAKVMVAHTGPDRDAVKMQFATVNEPDSAQRVFSNVLISELDQAKDWSFTRTSSAFSSNSQGAQSAQSATTFTRAALPVQNFQLIAQAASALKDQPIELTLRPKELGRVRLTMRSSEAGMAVSISVERAETLVLLRRNIDQFAEQLRDIGYQGLTFDFSEQEAGFFDADDQKEPHVGSRSNEAEVNADSTEPLPVRLRMDAQSGVDIRL